MARPNILYLHCHDTGRFTQPYGHNVATPNIQKLADEGILFRQAFCGGPTCSPSRAALLTGQYPHSCGMLGLAHRGFGLYDTRHHLVHTLKAAGYMTALAGTQHVATQPDTIGYDLLLDSGPATNPPVTQFEAVSSAAVEFLGEKPKEPFFLACGFAKPHGYTQTSRDPRYVMPPPGLPGHPIVREYTARFLSGVEAIDHHMGRVLDALERNGLKDNTLVICTTDHGIAFPGLKCTLTDRGIGVMLIMRGPAPFRGGKAIDAMVMHMDVFPTLMDWLELDPPDWLQGVSLAPLVRSERETVREEVVSEITYHATYEPQRCMRTQRWKYIRRFDQRRTRPLPNTDDSPVKDYLLEHGLRDRPVDAEQLYDLVFDPTESRNLAGDPKHGATLREMRDRLNAWMQDTRDPLLKGYVEAPPGAKMTDPWATYHVTGDCWQRLDAKG